MIESTDRFDALIVYKKGFVFIAAQSSVRTDSSRHSINPSLNNTFHSIRLAKDLTRRAPPMKDEHISPTVTIICAKERGDAACIAVLFDIFDATAQ